jgi:hypothetical protein
MGGMGQPIAEYLIEPLTTIFTPPPNCIGPTYTLGGGQNDTLISNSSYGDTLIHGYTSSCLPISALDIIYNPLPVNLQVGYSPGLCPSGWSTATAVYNPPKTSVFCCPT